MQEGVSPGTVGDQLDRFLDDLAIAGYSPLTVKHYRWKLRKRLPLDLPAYKLTTSMLRALVADQVRTKAPGTAHTFYGMLRSFSKYLKVSGLTAVNLMDGIPEPRLPEPQTKALSQEVLARLWQAACELDSEATREGGLSVGSSQSRTLATVPPPPGSRFSEPSGKRSTSVECSDSTTYRLLYLLLLTTGMRRAEVAGCRWDDIEGDVLRVLGKGRKYRRVLLTPEVLGLLGRNSMVEPSLKPNESVEDHPVAQSVCDLPQERSRNCGPAKPTDEYISDDEAVDLMRTIPEAVRPCVARHRPNPTTSSPIFGLSPSRIGQLFAQIARRAGVRCSAHALRHSWATEFLRSGGQMEAARILGGWSDMRQLATRYGKGAIEDAALQEARRIASGR